MARAVVSASWLRDALSRGAAGLALLEASWAADMHDKFASGHVPGARLYDMRHCVDSAPPAPRGRLPDPACWRRHMGELGVRPDQHVVLYCRSPMLWSARAWWTFRAFGHDNISVLDGGWHKWSLDDNSTSTDTASEQAGEALPERGQRRELLMTFEEVVEASRSRSAQVIDARQAEHFAGEEQEPAKPTVTALKAAGLPAPAHMQRGHVPGSRHLFENHLLDPDTKCLKSRQELHRVFAEAGVRLTDPSVTLCYNGFAASLLALAAAHLGHPHHAVFPGSWTEYGQRASERDVERGPCQAIPPPAA